MNITNFNPIKIANGIITEASVFVRRSRLMIRRDVTIYKTDGKWFFRSGKSYEPWGSAAENTYKHNAKRLINE